MMLLSIRETNILYQGVKEDITNLLINEALLTLGEYSISVYSSRKVIDNLTAARCEHISAYSETENGAGLLIDC